MEGSRLEMKAGSVSRCQQEMMILVRIWMRRAQAVTSARALRERQGMIVVDRHP